MNDTPGWASPGSAPSEGQEPGTSGPAEPADRNGPGPAGHRDAGEAPADRPEAQQQPTDRPQAQQPADAPQQPQQPGEWPQQPGRSPQDAQPGQTPQGPGVKWSKEQPPPNQWSAPTGAPGPQAGPGQAPPPPAPHAHPGWGGGWGAGWGGPPPAAKPGIIPLRPLGVGEILDGAVATMRTYWRTVLGIALTLAVITQIVILPVQRLVLDTSGSEVLNDPSPSPGEATRALGDLLLANGLIFLITLVGVVAATGLLATVTSRAVLGRPVTTGEAWRDARPQILRLLGLIGVLLLIPAVIVGAGSLPGILAAAAGATGPGVALSILGIIGTGVIALWLMVRLSLAAPALMLEKQGITRALKRSARLVHGSWWRIFGIQLLAWVIANVVASVIGIPFTFLAAALGTGSVTGFLDNPGEVGWTFLLINGIGAVIGTLIMFPIVAGVIVLLYIDQRIRREALDLELARAAGVPGYDSGATPGS
ncbi:glycerophosphoryl diester phosphodiesterase membrane domain-containing protein [Streptomyces thermospinosisporus]|uniref:Glycerophosphoryl diester phosphodiesterase membrane domain-containing protein n=1 Tax=Streptomyces thermospinosisporus TaxID=161482 RepID=A0ABN1ZAH3_9ACTN